MVKLNNVCMLFNLLGNHRSIHLGLLYFHTFVSHNRICFSAFVMPCFTHIPKITSDPLIGHVIKAVILLMVYFKFAIKDNNEF